MTASPTKLRVDFSTIQALRAVAALMVVYYHCLVRWAELNGVPESHIHPNGSAGVDVFFVISGFVMVVSSRKLVDLDNGWSIFLWRRLIRIVPLYWLMTTVRLAWAFHSAHGQPMAGLGLVNIVSSYLFLPSYDLQGQLRPVLAVGWTLEFEMLFYVLFAVALARRLPPLRVLVPVFGVLSVIAFIRTDEWPAVTIFANVLPLEFVYGVILGTLTLQGKRLGKTAAMVLIPLSIAALLLMPSGPTVGAAQGVGRVTLRVLTWGIPAALLVAAAIALELDSGLQPPRWLRALGDASYSIYLSHGFVLFGLGSILQKLHRPELVQLQVPMVLGGFLLASIAGYLLYVMIEKPLTERLKTTVPAPAGVVKV